MKLLTTPDHQPKAAKGIAAGYAQFTLHLSPGDLSGQQMCAGATPACLKGCLHGAGRGAMETTKLARLRRTHWLIDNPATFLDALRWDVDAGVRWAERRGLIPTYRLNGTSDRRWENDGIIEEYPELQFHDYTKLPNRRGLPANYYLTFSRAETATNHADVATALRSGQSVAIVFNTPKEDALPASFEGTEVIDGRLHDCRFLDPLGVYVGLSALGPAKKDTSGWVVAV
jgi:hypothetical protein